ncbi:MAG: DUF4234 domain-containing protein [Chloroflexota bacterium]|nr:DUF4234 domain-containing protein [Chloroflexota bacterium]
MAETNSPAGPPTIFCSSCGAVMERDARFCPSCGAANPHAAAAVGDGSGVKRTDHIKYRNMWVQVLLAIVTLGIYTIYWFHVTLGELYRANGNEEGSGCLWTFLSIIPIVQFFAYWHHSFQYEKFIDRKHPGIAIFILWIVFSPIVWFLVQRDLNAAAKGQPF